MFYNIKGCVTWQWRFEPFEYNIANILPNNRYFIRLLLVYSLPALDSLLMPPLVEKILGLLNSVKRAAYKEEVIRGVGVSAAAGDK